MCVCECKCKRMYEHTHTHTHTHTQRSDVTVNMEYERGGSLDVQRFHVIVPCPGEAEITDVGEGQAKYFAKKDTVEWKVKCVCVCV